MIQKSVDVFNLKVRIGYLASKGATQVGIAKLVKKSHVYVRDVLKEIASTPRLQQAVECMILNKRSEETNDEERK